MGKTFVLISSDVTTFISRRLITEAKKMKAKVEVINPLQTSFVIDGQQTTPLFKGKPLGKFDACYRKNIYAPIAVRLERYFWEKGTRVINPLDKPSPQTKFGDYQILANNGIPVPKTYLMSSWARGDECLDYFGHQFPLVAKFDSGTHGLGVFIIESLAAFKSLVGYLFEGQIVKELLIQEFIRSSYGRDRRVIVLGNEVLAAVERKSPSGDFRSNVFLGAKTKPVKLNREETACALKTIKALRLNFGGIDMMYGSQGPVISEVNAPCDYSFVEELTKVPISAAIIKYLLG